jgi:hypothetical protein
MRIDVPLEVGAATEAVTVTSEATLLKTESGELSHNVVMSQLLPVLGVNGGGLNSGSSGFRDPFSLTQMIPGTQYAVSNTLIVNGAPSQTENIIVEGQTAGNLGGLRGFTHQTQPSVDAIQEVAVQTSNFAAEFGTVGGGIFNISMKSGTNQYHGSLYNYAVNEFMNASQPYTGLKSQQRRWDYGGTLGGPVNIPGLYKGENKTFFFFNYEQYRENLHVANTPATVPIAPYRIGDFNQVIIGSGLNGVPRNIQVGGANYVDPLGRTVLSGTIFDPNSTRTVVCPATGSTCTPGANIVVRDPFTGNKFDASKFDPVSVKVLALVPGPEGPNAAAGQLGNNYQHTWLSHRTSEIPSVKLDHQVSAKGHASFYWGQTGTTSQYSFPNGNSVGLPDPIDPARGTFIYSPTFRVNYDHSLSSSILLHAGVGYSANNFFDYAPVVDYNAQTSLGLRGATINRNFPNFMACTGVLNACSVSTGGMQSLGPAGGIQSSGGTEHRPSANFNMSWLRGNHAFKGGFEARYEEYPTQTFTGAAGQYTFGSATTGGTIQPALQGLTLSQGSSGFGFADFLLGNVAAVNLAVPADYRLSKKQIGLFVQDTWKVTRKLTLDYGVRWDYGTYTKEQYGRVGNFDFNLPNASAGGHPGGSTFEATCKCAFADNYPYAIGPRLGVAYQINSKTVLRGGIGVVYTPTPVSGGAITNNTDGGTPGFGQYLFQLKDGIPTSIQPQWPNFAANIGQAVNTVTGAPAYLDRNAGRPARQLQWSIGLQRELSHNLVVEAIYVANRGVWWPANGFGSTLSAVDITSEQLLAKYGFKVGDTNDSALLTKQLGNLTAADKSTLIARGVNPSGPYAGFPTNQTVRQSLLPFPQYNTSIAPASAPLGKTWYDSLQTSVTKRLSHGLSVNANYTFSKTLQLMSSPDVLNTQLGKVLSGADTPHQLRISAEYRAPRIKSSNAILGNKVLTYALADWGMGWFLQYQSAAALALPASAGTNPISNWLGRGPGPAQLVDGQSIWSTDWTDYSGTHHTDPIDINCHCFDPTKNIVLNKNAWQSVPNGQWAANQATALRYFRGIRRPQENVNISRTFRIKERVNFQVRAELANVFNRLVLPQPSVTGFTANPTQANGVYTGGFGTIVPISGTSGQRSGQIIGRLEF